jgi:hypothetical protein
MVHEEHERFVKHNSQISSSRSNRVQNLINKRDELHLDLQHTTIQRQNNYSNTDKLQLRRGVDEHRPSTMDGDGADGLFISPVEVAGASSAWRRGDRDGAGSVRAALGKQRRCGRWHRVRVMKQEVRGGDGGASRRSSALSVARL